jgi:putative transposase
MLASHPNPIPIMRNRRILRPGGQYFFTLVTYDRRPLLVDHIDRLRHAFLTTRRRRPFILEAIVVLPDHLHTMWRLPEGDPDYSTRWASIKRIFSTTFSRALANETQRRRRDRGIWQRRFWEHCIRDEADWRRHFDYVHYNPVKHGYCSAPSEWPHSSFGRMVEKGWYASDWGETAPAGIEGMDPE